MTNPKSSGIPLCLRMSVFLSDISITFIHFTLRAFELQVQNGLIRVFAVVCGRKTHELRAALPGALQISKGRIRAAFIRQDYSAAICAAFSCCRRGFFSGNGWIAFGPDPQGCGGRNPLKVGERERWQEKLPCELSHGSLELMPGLEPGTSSLPRMCATSCATSARWESRGAVPISGRGRRT